MVKKRRRRLIGEKKAMLNKNFSISGGYKFTVTFCTMFNMYKYDLPENKNLITSNGENYFLRRWINNELGVVSKIGLGTGFNPPLKTDIGLNNKTTESTVNSKIDLTNNQIELTALFTGSKSNGCTEIGVLTDNNTLISRDVFDSLQIPSASTLNLTYIYRMETGLIKTNWLKTEDTSYVYEQEESQTVKAVIETDTKNGYHLTESINDCDNESGSYYYDNDDGVIYVHVSDDTTPNDHSILIKF